MQVGLVTGGSLGLGRAVVLGLAGQGWTIVTDARRSELLETLDDADLSGRIITVVGDVADADHRAALRSAVEALGRLDLLLNNASRLGPSPLPLVRDHPLSDLEAIFDVDLIAPVALFQAHRDLLTASHGAVVNVSSDAAVEAYPNWGGYGAAKAALDQMSAVLVEEEPDIDVYAFDPGDMRTELHQSAFPEDDISDLPEPETILPALLTLIGGRPPSGRYRAVDLNARGVSS